MGEKIRVGLLGLGTVGSGVVEIIDGHQKDLYYRTGYPIGIEKILVKNRYKERRISVEEELLTTDPWEVLENEAIDVVVEVMGGIDPAHHYIREALRRGKHVVTANKDLIALYGRELLSLARENHCDLFYEASVAGGIPILRALQEGLSADRITQMMGIINGTSNYILTQMSQVGESFTTALQKAQELGYAESDPTADVEGLDAARKMAILATLGFRMDVALEDVSVEGIGKVTVKDIQLAKKLGYTLKLIGLAQQDRDGVEISVQPTLLPISHPLAGVDGVFNAIYVHGEAVGETMFYGPGAGSLPTASAVVSDLVAVGKNKRLGTNGRGIVAPYQKKRVKGVEQKRAKHFLRLQVTDQVGVLAQLTQLFAQYEVSFEKILQEPGGEQAAEIVLVTHTASLANFQGVMEEMEKLEAVRQVYSCYRVEGDD